jgi:hypothetical protein
MNKLQFFYWTEDDEKEPSSRGLGVGEVGQGEDKDKIRDTWRQQIGRWLMNRWQVIIGIGQMTKPPKEPPL